jgi:hypothetical protein
MVSVTPATAGCAIAHRNTSHRCQRAQPTAASRVLRLILAAADGMNAASIEFQTQNGTAAGVQTFCHHLPQGAVWTVETMQPCQLDYVGSDDMLRFLKDHADASMVLSILLETVLMRTVWRARSGCHIRSQRGLPDSCLKRPPMAR